MWHAHLVPRTPIPLIQEYPQGFLIRFNEYAFIKEYWSLGGLGWHLTGATRPQAREAATAARDTLNPTPLHPTPYNLNPKP